MNYLVIWWDAYGIVQVSEKMDKVTASVFCESMFPEQGACIVFVR